MTDKSKSITKASQTIQEFIPKAPTTRKSNRKAHPQKNPVSDRLYNKAWQVVESYLDAQDYKAAEFVIKMRDGAPKPSAPVGTSEWEFLEANKLALIENAKKIDILNNIIKSALNEPSNKSETMKFITDNMLYIKQLAEVDFDLNAFLNQKTQD